MTYRDRREARAERLRTGMPDGHAFELVHADGGTQRCADGSGNRAAYRGAAGQQYA